MILRVKSFGLKIRQCKSHVWHVPGDLVVVAEEERDILGGVASLLIALLLLLEFALWIKVV